VVKKENCIKKNILKRAFEMRKGVKIPKIDV
jgi:hypothetical protein